MAVAVSAVGCATKTIKVNHLGTLRLGLLLLVLPLPLTGCSCLLLSLLCTDTQSDITHLYPILAYRQNFQFSSMLQLLLSHPAAHTHTTSW